LEILRAYPWSSFRAYAGYGPAAPWLCREELLDRAGGAQAYRRLAEEQAGRGLAEPLVSQLKWGWVLGGERFARKLREQMKVGRESSGRRALRERRTWAEVIRALERARGQKWPQFAQRHGDPALAMALYVARRRTGLTLRALGQAAGGMDYTAVGMAIKRFEGRLKKEKALQKMTETLALAPSTFGEHADQLLVGNLGSGTIMTFDANGHFKGLLERDEDRPVTIDGLWGLTFGADGGVSGVSTDLYFSAGPNDYQHGLFGVIQAVSDDDDRDGHGHGHGHGRNK
jgi:hypothetical protein